MKSLLQKSLKQYTICTFIVLLLATPLFYLLTKYFYAEDLRAIIEATQSGHPVPPTDLEQDTISGIVLQFALTMGILLISLVLMLKFISKRLWAPFDDTMQRTELFSLEKGEIPIYIKSDIKEFNRLNAVLTRLTKKNLQIYKMQKEFTENASHELQTPIAVFKSKLDLLLQQPNLTEQQADLLQSLYDVAARLARLNKNLLLLAKIENKQYSELETVDLVEVVNRLLPLFSELAQDMTIHKKIEMDSCPIRANRILLESLMNNLIINAFRHNRPKGEITIAISNHELTVSNTSSEGEIDQDTLYKRFHRSTTEAKGNGLGLAIIKAICDFHGWEISYYYKAYEHQFSIYFSK